jgi:hypothetical protein
MAVGATWYKDVALAAARHNCTFFHAGALQRTSNFQSDLLAAIRGVSLTPYLVRWDAVARDGWEGALPSSDSVMPGSILLLWAPETLAGHRGFREILRQSRPKGQEALASGARVMIVSSRPKLFFPEPDGSSIIADGTKIHPHAVQANDLLEMIEGLELATAKRLVGYAGKSRALAEEYLKIEATELSGNKKRSRAQSFLRQTLQSALLELEPDSLSLLEHLVLENGFLDVPEMDVPAHHASAWEDAGLAVVDDDTGMVRIFAECWRSSVKEILAASIQEVTAAPETWVQLAQSLFEVERTIRLMVIRRLQDTYGGKWRELGMGNLAAKALGLARGDMHGAKEVDDLYLPLDWLLLDELFELAASSARSAGDLGGLSESDWKRMASRLVPIRNRVMHMRLPRPGDVGEVRQSLRFLQSRLKGGLNPPRATSDSL